MGMGRGRVSRGHQAPAGASLRVGRSGNAHHARHGTPRPRARESTSPPPPPRCNPDFRPRSEAVCGLRIASLWVCYGSLLAPFWPFGARSQLLLLEGRVVITRLKANWRFYLLWTG